MPISPLDMLRQLLTLLAILTGFATAAEPVQAATSGVEQVRVQDGGELTASSAVLRSVSPPHMTRRAAEPAAGKVNRHGPMLPVHVPTVMIGPDRARE